MRVNWGVVQRYRYGFGVGGFAICLLVSLVVFPVKPAASDLAASVPGLTGGSNLATSATTAPSPQPAANHPIQPAVTPSNQTTAAVPQTQIGVYTGPGATTAHDNFSRWLGGAVPYATDYVDYKNGWQADFVDSQVWLEQKWGPWVAAHGGRLVLGVPMLENANAGQFSQGAAGQFDQFFQALAVALVQNGLGNSIIRLGYEANCDTIGPWEATTDPAGYRALFRHEVAVMRAMAGADFQFDWTVCNGLQGGKPLNSFGSFYPGDDAVNIMGMDIYDVKWLDPAATPQQRWIDAATRPLGLDEFNQFARQHHKPVSYPEWGLYKPGDNFAGGGDDPYFVQQMFNLIKSTAPVYQSYFDLDWGGGVLSDFPASANLYRQLIGG